MHNVKKENCGYERRTNEGKGCKEAQLDIIRQECINAVEDNYPGESKVVVFGEGDSDASIVLL